MFLARLVDSRLISQLRDVPDQVTVIRKRHAFEGETLAVISSIKRRGVLLVLVILPNGSRSLVPAAWTDWRDADASPIDEDIDDTSSLGKLGDLLQLRKVIGETNTRFSDWLYTTLTYGRLLAISECSLVDISPTYLITWLGSAGRQPRQRGSGGSAFRNDSQHTECWSQSLRPTGRNSAFALDRYHAGTRQRRGALALLHGLLLAYRAKPSPLLSVQALCVRLLGALDRLRCSRLRGHCGLGSRRLRCHLAGNR